MRITVPHHWQRFPWAASTTEYLAPISAPKRVQRRCVDHIGVGELWSVDMTLQNQDVVAEDEIWEQRASPMAIVHRSRVRMRRTRTQK